MGTKVYFFKGAEVARFDRGEDRFDQQPRLIREDPKWIGLHKTGIAEKIDSAVRWDNGFIYFFSGDEFVRHRIEDNVVDLARRKTRDVWPGMHETGFAHKIDAAINYGNGKAYFFQDKDYVRYDMKKDTVELEHTRNPIEKEWNGMKTAENEDRDFTKNIDAALQYGNGKVYFFKQDKYIRYDIADDKLDAGPLNIHEKWPGLEDSSFLSNLDAVVDELDETKDLFIPGAQLDLAPTNNAVPFTPSPWRGVLHTTEDSHPRPPDCTSPSLPGSLKAFNKNKTWPHITIDPETGTIIQHFSLNVGSRSLRTRNPAVPNDPNIQTNSLHCIQIEIVKCSEHGYSIQELEFIRDVMRRVEELVPIPRKSELSFLNFAGVNAAPNNNKMTLDAWNKFSGWCGHQHVPKNDHTDPGAIDINFLLS